VVYIIPALDGSRIVGDLFLRNLSVSNEELYRDMIPGLVDGYLGGLLNIVIRLLPKSVVKGLLNSVLDGLVGDVISYSTTMWSLVPSGDYEAARKLWLEDGKHDEIRKQTDAYWQAQKDSRKNIEDMVKLGVHVYDIVDYDVQLLSIVGSYKDQNADGIIHLDSTSMGCTAAKVGETLPVGYKQAVSDGHNHLSPDGVLDASTGTLPDNTFYFKGQTHEGTSKNDVIMRLTTRLVTATEYETVFSMPGEYEQFSYKRETKGLRNDLLPIAKKVDTTDLSAEDKAALAEAIADVERALEPTIVTPGDVEAAGARLEAVLVKIGVRNAPEPDYASMILDPIGWFLNQAFYYLWGPRGFSDGLLSIWLQ
ncbi:MAG: hypothetical protein LBS96_04600, partial [Oscillospiraceae bacterium]|nr:hypothetical protein [Oscillospiraceae bacterium]